MRSIQELVQIVRVRLFFLIFSYSSKRRATDTTPMFSFMATILKNNCLKISKKNFFKSFCCMSLAILTRKQSFVRFQQKKFVAVAWNLFPCPLSLRKPLGRLKMAASICKNRKKPYITRDVLRTQ